VNGGAAADAGAVAVGSAGEGGARGAAEPQVLRLYSLDRLPLAMLLARYSLALRLVAPGEVIPGSYWGESEAGLIGNQLYARLDTPLHSVLHEAGHYVCMSPERRAMLDRDAGGARLLDDMDAWGYSFRLGSARAWLAQDAADARDWLRREGIIAGDDSLTGQCRC
jgi:hypothetical protein